MLSFRGTGILACIVLLCGWAYGTSAQVPQLDRQATEVLKELRPLKPRLIAVVDFRPVDGASALQAHYFALLLSTTLQEKEKKISVADHLTFDSDLTRLHLSAADLLPGDSLRSNAARIGPEILVTGTVQKTGKLYLLHIAPVRVASAEFLPTLSSTVETSEFFESLFMPMPSDVVVFKVGSKPAAVSLPTCVYCPNPSYSNAARVAKTQGASVFDVLVSAEGRAVQIRPVKLLGYGLDQQAYYAIKDWKFKPARDAQGTPIPLIVPIEVTFRLF
jgi:hypothetical protein